MKLKFIYFILLFSVQLFSQLSFTSKNNAANLHKNSFELNKLITVSSLGGDYEKALQMITSLDKNTLNYKISNSILLYNVNGKKTSLNFIDKLNNSKEEKNYLKTFVSLITKNIDDYTFYKTKLKDELFILKIEIRELLQSSYSSKWDEIIKKIELFLKTKKINKEDTIFLTLVNIDFKNDRKDLKKYDIIRTIWNNHPEKLDITNVNLFAEDCESETCKEFRILLTDEKESIVKVHEFIGDDVLPSYMARRLKKSTDVQNIEQQLQEILKNEKDNVKKELVKSYINLFDNTNSSSSKNKLPYVFPKFDFTDDFKNGLASNLSKKEVIDFIKKDSKYFFEQRTPILKELANLSKEESYFLLGYLMYLKTSEAKFEEDNSLKITDLKNNATYTEKQSSNAFFNYLQKEPLSITMDSRFISIPDIKNIGDYNKNISLLKKYTWKNNYDFKKLKLFSIFNPVDFFVLDEENAILFFNELIDIFSLNQYEGHPSLDSNKGSSILHYSYNNKINDKASNGDGKTENELFSILLEKINEEAFTKIITKLTTKISEHPNSQNLKALHLKLFLNSNMNLEYYHAYLSYIPTSSNLPHFKESILKKLKNTLSANQIKNDLINTYKKTEHKANLTSLIDLYLSANLFDEAVNLMAYNLKNSSSYYQDKYIYTINEKIVAITSANQKREEYFDIIILQNKQFDKPYVFKASYQVLNGNLNKAIKTLEKMKADKNIKLSSTSRELNNITNLLKNTDIKTETIELFNKKLEEIYQ